MEPFEYASAGPPANRRDEGVEAIVHRLLEARDERVHVDYAEAGHRLGVSEKWLRERIGSLPHRKMGKFVLFSVQDLQTISEMYAVRPDRRDGREAAPPPSGTGLSALRPARRARQRAA